MSKPAKHSSGAVKGSLVLPAVIAGAFSFLTGVILLPFVVTELLRYSPYGNPGAGTTGLWLGVTALILIAVPALALTALSLRKLIRDYRRWKRGLPAGQRAVVTFLELIALEGAHLAWRDHNRQESERLSASVMGEARKDQPWQ